MTTHQPLIIQPSEFRQDGPWEVLPDGSRTNTKEAVIERAKRYLGTEFLHTGVMLKSTRLTEYLKTSMPVVIMADCPATWRSHVKTALVKRGDFEQGYKVLPYMQAVSALLGDKDSLYTKSALYTCWSPLIIDMTTGPFFSHVPSEALFACIQARRDSSRLPTWIVIKGMDDIPENPSLFSPKFYEWLAQRESLADHARVKLTWSRVTANAQNPEALKRLSGDGSYRSSAALPSRPDVAPPGREPDDRPKDDDRE